MNALTIWQPWASAIALGVKKVETRGWACPEWAIGVPMAILAGRKNGKEGREAWERLVLAEPETFGIFGAAGIRCWEEMPFGAVVCVVKVTGCEPTDYVGRGQVQPAWFRGAPDERRWGDHGPGRWAWIIGEVRRIEPPFQLIGRQGIFEARELV